MSYKEIVWNGLWKNNVGLVQLLGLCPLLAVTTSVVNGVGLGLATTFVMTMSNGIVSLARKVVPGEVRIPVFILIIAALVTLTDLAMNAYVHHLYLVLGIYIPLIVANCSVLGRTEVFAAKNPVLPSLVDGLMMGIGATIVLGVLGGIREVFGQGTLFSGINMVFGEAAKSWVITVVPDYEGMLYAVLPPGAFLGLGAMLAIKNWISLRGSSKAVPAGDQTVNGLDSAAVLP
ncbi:electron transport complex subunit E [Sulfurimicrobium lacus]|uniref:Ion-translocating oxidoreductase complex subunit E n=1 Tax=Sulfurimicrobium lacus TaxID=2715678 RepID=A0A6F8VAU6_9PROT|nr:electron transport complex subunit E [Sulfurimicrobium lacus]BCB26271.1 electron transport complex subunit E [Sulfurimicrobium lacus]